MEKDFNEQDSLKVINQMIAQVNSNIQIGAASSMVMAGYTVATIAILNIILIHTLDKPYFSFWVWMLMIPYAIIQHFIEKKRDKKAIVRTYMDTIVGKTWKAFTISVVVLLIVIFGLIYISETWILSLLFNPVILTLTGLAQYATAATTRFKPFLWGAFTLWCGAILCMLLLPLFGKTVEIQFVILAICMILGFSLPGHMLNKKAKVNV
ncbi:hypothetical protein GGR21_003036 [Dysgonomonas hofstadii]|uniref:Uncharacterized protein n=1 Tax=Dysgonomonas hofstadii TaxID=637886 RepID=A0A840CPY8_9BACT|nr:hypothetical protein [Dysgonomonas hofstadii]MBB4037121.1 hypothetical protein [Dysgonomonas hofstadii]